jgi:hypothetical protein
MFKKIHFVMLAIILLATIKMVNSQTKTSVKALITDSKGVRTEIENIVSYYSESCGSFMYYKDISRRTEFEWDYIPINTQSYIVNVPFDIISIISLIDEENNIYSIKLTNGSIFTGNLSAIDQIRGDTDLGKFQLPKSSLKEINFKHSSIKESFSAIPRHEGKGSTILIINTQEELNILNSIFVFEGRNKNGCYIGEEYADTISFEVGDSKYNIGWEKIGKIIFPMGEGKEEVRLVTKSGNEYSGKIGGNENVNLGYPGIQGLAKVGSFTLRITIPFNSKAKEIRFL